MICRRDPETREQQCYPTVRLSLRGGIRESVNPKTRELQKPREYKNPLNLFPANEFKGLLYSRGFRELGMRF